MTDERRTALREAVAELADAAREELPLLAAELERAVAAPMPVSPEDDPVWVAAVKATIGRDD